MADPVSAAPRNPTPAALALLNQTGTPDVKSYLHGFIGQNLPHLNFAIITQNDDVQAELKKSLAQALERRPELQQRLAADVGLQKRVSDYLETASKRILEGRTKDGFENLEGNNTGPAGVYHLDSRAPADLREAGLGIIAVSMDGHSGCRGCQRKHDGPMACSEIASPSALQEVGINRLAGQSFFYTGAKPLLGSVSTAFHELAHGIDLHARSNISINFEHMFGNKSFTSKIESTADAFATLMLVREFGDLGKVYAQNKTDPADVPATAGHYTRHAVVGALKWADENPDALKSMSVQELFDHSRRIGHAAALTQEQAADFSKFLSSVYGTSSEPAQYQTDIVDRYRQELDDKVFPSGRVLNALTRVELGRLSEANMLACTAPPTSEDPAPADASAARSQQRKPDAAPGS